MKAHLFFLFFVIISSNASAGSLPAPFNIIYEEVFDGDWTIADKHGKQTKDIKTTDNSWAWVCIVGFENESIINRTRYVNGTPRSFAIVKYDSGYSVPEDCVFVSYDVELKVVDTEWDHTIGTTEAILHTKFVYKERVCSILGGCHWVFYREEITTSSIVESPETFNNSIDDYEITITSYNNSVGPYTLIYVPQRENIIKHSVYYKNGTASWYNLTGLVKENHLGTEYVRFLNETGFVTDESKTITRRAEYFVINEAPLNWSMLDIHVYTPYIDVNSSVCNATIYNSKPSDFVAWKPLAILLGILTAFMIGIYMVRRRKLL